MSTSSRVVARIATFSLAAVALIASAVSPPNASAASGVFEIKVTYVGEATVQFGFCLSDSSKLPARLAGAYEVKQGATTVASESWTIGNSDFTVVRTQLCPRPLKVFQVGELAPGTEFTINASMNITPRIEYGGWYQDDPARPPVVVTESAVGMTKTLPSGAPTPTASPAPTPTASPAPTPTASPAPTPTASPAPTTPSANPSGTSGLVVVTILNPRAFSVRQLAMLNPAQLSTVAPRSLAAIRPSVLRTITTAQARALQPAQVRALKPATIRSLSPATIRALSPTSFAALRIVQLRSLTPLQANSLTRAQLAQLSRVQRGALGPN